MARPATIAFAVAASVGLKWSQAARMVMKGGVESDEADTKVAAAPPAPSAPLDEPRDFEKTQAQRQQEPEADMELWEKGFSELKGMVKDLLARQPQATTFEWEIKNPVEMKAQHPKLDDEFRSPEFFLRGLGPWQVSIFPSGHWKAPGGVGVFLEGSASTASSKVQYRLTVNGVSHDLEEDVFDGTLATAWGWNFPGLAWPATNDEPVHVKVEILKVTHIATTE